MRSFAQAAQTETEAVPLRTVQIEGSVALKIVKRCKECMPALVTGQLLGLHIGSILEVTNCFPFLLNPSRFLDHRYQSTYMGSFQTVELIETLMNYQENIKRCVCIIYDPLRSSQGVLALKALKLAEGFMELREKNSTLKDVFEEIPVKICNFALVSSMMTELEPDVQATQGMSFLTIATMLTENAARRAAGEEPLPEEEPNNPIFKTRPEPSRLDSYLISNQIWNYCSQVNG
uniref:eIF3h C-terminal domain-containing protein n=1 Tax=Physcomitrium patens TaxID=3218 RepID=A0A7I4CP47_PHYPA